MSARRGSVDGALAPAGQQIVTDVSGQESGKSTEHKRRGRAAFERSKTQQKPIDFDATTALLPAHILNPESQKRSIYNLADTSSQQQSSRGASSSSLPNTTRYNVDKAEALAAELGVLPAASLSYSVNYSSSGNLLSHSQPQGSLSARDTVPHSSARQLTSVNSVPILRLSGGGITSSSLLQKQQQQKQQQPQTTQLLTIGPPSSRRMRIDDDAGATSVASSSSLLSSSAVGLSTSRSAGPLSLHHSDSVPRMLVVTHSSTSLMSPLLQQSSQHTDGTKGGAQPQPSGPQPFSSSQSSPAFALSPRKHHFSTSSAALNLPGSQSLASLQLDKHNISNTNRNSSGSIALVPSASTSYLSFEAEAPMASARREGALSSSRALAPIPSSSHLMHASASSGMISSSFVPSPSTATTTTSSSSSSLSQGLDMLASMGPRALVSRLAAAERKAEALMLELSLILRDKGGGMGQGQEDVDQLMHMNEQLKTHMQKLLQRFGELRLTNDEQSERLTNALGQLSSKERREMDLEALTRSLNEEKALLIVRCEEANSEIKEREEELIETRKRLEIEDSEVQRLRLEVDVQRSEHEKEADKLRKDVAMLEHIRNELHSQGDVLAAEGATLRKELEIAYESLRLSARQAADAADELRAVSAAKHSLTIERDVGLQRIKNLETSLKSLENEHMQTLRAIGELNRSIGLERMEFQRRLKEVNDLTKVLSKQIADLDSERAALRTRVAALELTVEAMKEENAALGVKLEAAKAVEATLQNTITEKEGKIVDLAGTLESRDARIESLMKQLEESKDSHRAEKARADKFAEEIQKVYIPLENLYEETQTKLSETENKLSAAMKTVAALNRSLLQEKSMSQETLAKLELTERSAQAVNSAKAMLQNEVAALKQASKQQSGLVRQMQLNAMGGQQQGGR